MAFKRFASRILPASLVLAAALLSTSCGEDTTGVATPGLASVRVQPRFSASQFAPITLNRVQAIVERVTVDTANESTTRDTLVNISRSFSPSDSILRLPLRIPLQGSSEDLQLSLFYFADQTPLFSGLQQITVATGSNPDADPLELSYIGPGSNAVGLIIEPFDTTVAAGSTTPFRATAINGQEQDVGPFYMRWSVSSATNGASIDASGRLRAPSVPGTIWVKGLLPNGVDDSVQVTVSGTPTSMTIASGQGQSGGPGITLEIPLSVFVSGAGGAPIQGVAVNWAATVGGGSVSAPSTLTDADGFASVIATLGPNQGLNRFTASSPGLPTITFSANEDQIGSVVVWAGNTNSDWSDSENWAGGKVPNVLDSVVIPSAEFYPVLDTTPVISALTLTGNGRLTINNHGIVIIRGLTLLGDSYLEMLNQSDAISVGGDAIFDGGNSTGHMIAGGISIAGSFEQRATNSSASFVSSGTHVFVLAGGPTTSVAFTTPGLGSNQSHFNDIAWSGQGTLRLNSNVFAHLMTASFQGVGTTISSIAGRELHVAQFLTPGQTRLTFDNVSLTMTDTTVVQQPSLSLITFQNMPTNRAQLTLNYKGGTIALSQFIFSTTPVAPNGVYIDATDSQVGDGSSLTVQVQNPTPTSMGSFFREGGDAEIIWPFNPP